MFSADAGIHQQYFCITAPQSTYWQRTNVVLLVSGSSNEAELYDNLKRKKVWHTTGCRIHQERFISSLNEIHLEKHPTRDHWRSFCFIIVSLIVFDWNLRKLFGFECRVNNTLCHCLVVFGALCSQIKFLLHESRPAFLCCDNQSNPHQRFLSSLPFTSELYFGPSADRWYIVWQQMFGTESSVGLMGKTEPCSMYFNRFQMQAECHNYSWWL